MSFSNDFFWQCTLHQIGRAACHGHDCGEGHGRVPESRDAGGSLHLSLQSVREGSDDKELEAAWDGVGGGATSSNSPLPYRTCGRAERVRMNHILAESEVDRTRWPDPSQGWALVSPARGTERERDQGYRRSKEEDAMCTRGAKSDLLSACGRFNKGLSPAGTSTISISCVRFNNFRSPVAVVTNSGLVCPFQQIPISFGRFDKFRPPAGISTKYDLL